MKQKTENNECKRLTILFIKFLSCEILGSLFIAMLEGGHFLLSLKKTVFAISVVSICLLGIEIVSALDNNRWRIKQANEEYPLGFGIVLILLNAAACLICGPNERTYVIFFVPIVLWGMMLLLNRITRWFRF